MISEDSAPESYCPLIKLAKEMDPVAYFSDLPMYLMSFKEIQQQTGTEGTICYVLFLLSF